HGRARSRAHAGAPAARARLGRGDRAQQARRRAARRADQRQAGGARRGGAGQRALRGASHRGGEPERARRAPAMIAEAASDAPFSMVALIALVGLVVAGLLWWQRSRGAVAGGEAILLVS